MSENTYTPDDWYWIVAGDETRYWSSAAYAYVSELPEGYGFTRIASEAELDEVLRQAGLRGMLVTSTDLYAERERRIAMPLPIFGLSVGPISINMDGESQRNLGGLGQIGILRVITSSSETTEFKAYDNELYQLTPNDLILMGVQVAERVQACYRAEWALKDMSPIPLDYTDDRYWVTPAPTPQDVNLRSDVVDITE